MGNLIDSLISGRTGAFDLKGYRQENVAFTFTRDDYHVEQITSGLTDFLPLSTSHPLQIFVYSNVSGGDSTLSITGGDTIYNPTGEVTSIPIYDGETYKFHSRPNGGWKQTT